MNKNRKSDRSADGSAIVTVMVVMVVVCALVRTAMNISMQNSYTAQRLADRLRAQAIAEAGVNQAYSLLVTNFAARTDPNQFPDTYYGGGLYVRTVTPVGTNMALIVCTGTYHSVSVCVMADCKNYGPATSEDSDDTDLGLAAGYAIFAGGNIAFSASGTFNASSNCLFHANGNFAKTGNGTLVAHTVEVCGDFANGIGLGVIRSTNFLVGGNMTLLGTATWNINTIKVSNAISNPGAIRINSQDVDCDIYSNTGSGGFTPTNAVSTNQNYAGPSALAVPNIDLTPYYNEALTNSEVYNGDITISGASPVGGIMWVNGKLTINGAAPLTGCFIATGGLEVKASGAYTKYANYPALVSRDSDVTVGGAGSFKGLIYAKTGSITKSGSGTIVGQIVAANKVTLTGVNSVMVYEDSEPTPPGQTGGSGAGPDIIGISAWQK